MQTQSFTTKHDGLVNVLKTDVQISLPTKSEIEFRSLEKHSFFAIWDTGATSTCITQNVAKQLDLKPIRITEIRTPGGVFLKNVYLVNIYLPNKVVIPFASVVEVSDLTQNPDDKIEILIGMDIIAIGDFAVTNKAGKTIFSFRFPSVCEIDFVKEFNQQLVRSTGRNDLCPCGSGKKFKNCHLKEFQNQ